MYLNTLRPSEGSKKPKTRLGRGIGSGKGKTSGRGHKGQRARAGGFHKVGFEGGQMPMQRRLPKFGFTTQKSLYRQQVNLNELNSLTETTVNLATLSKAGIITKNTKFVKIIASGEIKKALTIVGLPVTKGAKAAIIAAGGKVEESK